MHNYPKINNSFINKVLYTISIVVSIFLLTQCRSLQDKLTEGTIEYEIVYTNNSTQNIPLQLLPKTMQVKFNHNFVSYTIEDKFGVFSICNIQNLRKQSQITLIKLFNKKYVYQAGKKETPVFFSSNIPYKVNFIKDTMRLAGLFCKRASVIDPQSMKCYDIAYTSNVELKDPNHNTPYKKINGVLMKFELQMKSLDMMLTAKKIVQKKIDDEDFLLPEEYKFISKKQMEEILSNLLP